MADNYFINRLLYRFFNPDIGSIIFKYSCDLQSNKKDIVSYILDNYQRVFDKGGKVSPEKILEVFTNHVKDDMIYNWDNPYDPKNYLNWYVCGYYQTKNDFCVCNHSIKGQFICVHRFLKKYIIVGVDCLKKFGLRFKVNGKILKKVYEGGKLCSCGCGKFVRKDIINKFNGQKKFFTMKCLNKKYYDCFHCGKYIGYNTEKCYTCNNCICQCDCDVNIKKIHIPFEKKENDYKLKNFIEVKPENLNINFFCRYTYKIDKDNRKCVFAKLVLKNDDIYTFEAYKNQSITWDININLKIKRYRFYKQG